MDRIFHPQNYLKKLQFNFLLIYRFNEEQIESLFGYNAADKAKNDRRKEASALEPAVQYIQIIDRKKAQNLAILLRALNVTTEEVADALREGDSLCFSHREKCF